EFALRSHQLALKGDFSREIVPVGEVARDEGPRGDTSLEKLARLKPAFRPGGTVTAGNSSSLNDGAAALLIASVRKAQELGLTPLCVGVGQGVSVIIEAL